MQPTRLSITYWMDWSHEATCQAQEEGAEFQGARPRLDGGRVRHEHVLDCECSVRVRCRPEKIQGAGFQDRSLELPAGRLLRPDQVGRKLARFHLRSSDASQREHGA